MGTSQAARLARLGADVSTLAGWSLAVLLSLDIPANANSASHARYAVYGLLALCVLALIVRYVAEARHEGRRDNEAQNDRRLIGQMGGRIDFLVAETEARKASETISPDDDTTLIKVRALMLADEIYGQLAAHYRDEASGITTEADLLRDFAMLYSYSVRSTRRELADLGKTDVLLDRFAHRQEDADSIATTAQVIRQLAEGLPELDTFPTGIARNDGSTAQQRYEEHIESILEQARKVAGENAAQDVILPPRPKRA